MSDVAPSNHAGGRGTHGEGKESATADDDREGMRRKISSNHGLEAKNPGFRYHSSLNLIVQSSHSASGDFANPYYFGDPFKSVQKSKSFLVS
jgi:hypothetical protein